MRNISTKQFTYLSFFIIMEIVLGFTPLGFIPLGFVRLTTMHIPVICASLLLGYRSGIIMGLIFAAISMLQNTMTFTLTSFVFSPVYGNIFSFIIATLPRVLLGVVPYFILKFMRNYRFKVPLTIFLSSMIHTLLVVGGMFVFFAEPLTTVFRNYNAFIRTLATIISVNGVLGAIAATIIGTAIYKIGEEDDYCMKKILLGVTGTIAAYKAIQLCSDLVKKQYDVEVVLSENATKFVQPLTFEALTNKKVYTDTFAFDQKAIDHIQITDNADAFVVIASADFIAKANCGIADSMLLTTFLAADCPKIICPAMNTRMWENPITQKNIQSLLAYGMHIVEPDSGLLACKVVRKGKLAPLPTILQTIDTILYPPTIFKGKKIAISLGACQEPIDPVRFITNASSGKMGVALTNAFLHQGAQVTIVAAHHSVPLPSNATVVHTTTALDMLAFFEKEYQNFDIIIMCAAVSDYRPKIVSPTKIKKEEKTLTLELVKNPDILHWLTTHKHKNQLIVGFSLETNDVVRNSQEKRIRKQVDILLANDASALHSDTTTIHILDTNTTTYTGTKQEVANKIVTYIGDTYVTSR